MAKKPATAITIISCFFLLLSLSYARSPSLLPKTDATDRLFAVDLTEVSDPKSNVLLPTDKLREPSDPASPSSSTAAVNLEANSEEKEKTLATEIVAQDIPEKDLPASGSFPGKIVEDVASEERFDSAGDKRLHGNVVVVGFHPMKMMNRHMDRTWMVRRLSHKGCRLRNGGHGPMGIQRWGPHHQFWGEENDAVSRKVEDQRRSYKLPVREFVPFFHHPRTREGMADGNGLMIGEFKRPRFHFFHHHFHKGHHHNHHHDHERDDHDEEHEAREHMEKKRSGVWRKIRKFLTQF